MSRTVHVCVTDGDEGHATSRLCVAPSENRTFLRSRSRQAACHAGWRAIECDHTAKTGAPAIPPGGSGKSKVIPSSYRRRRVVLPM